jgi:cytochrome c peroxidase
MHNGVYNTLEEVIEFYHKGGGAGLGFEVPNQTLPFDSLLLDAREKEDLVLFLKSLSDVEKDSPNSGGK